MKKLTCLSLGVFIVSSSMFLTPTAATAADLNIGGLLVLSINTTTSPRPLEEHGCDQYDYSWSTARNQTVQMTLNNAYGTTIASEAFYADAYAGTGTGSIQVCVWNDFTGPLSLNILLIPDVGAADSNTSHPFAFLPVAPAPVAPAPVAPAPVAPAPISSATKEASTAKASEEPNTENAAKPTQDNSLDKTETQSPAVGLSPISILLYSFLGTALALGSGALAWKTFARTVSKKGK